MKLYIYIIFIMILTACSSENKISLFNDLYYELSNNEKVLKVSDVKNDYESFVSTDKVNIPLFKCIATSQYRVFIGLPYEISFSDLDADFIKGTLLAEDKNETSIYKKYKKNKSFITEYVVKKEQGLLVIFCVSQKENTLTKEELENKIMKNEK